MQHVQLFIAAVDQVADEDCLPVGVTVFACAVGFLVVELDQQRFEFGGAPVDVADDVVTCYHFLGSLRPVIPLTVGI